MGARGPKSSADLEVIESGKVISMPSPEPPEDLTAEQAKEWRKIIESLGADWFPRETWPVLAQLCRHIVRAREFAQLIETVKAAEELDLKLFRDLSRSEEEQSRAIASLSTKLRITQQATVDKRTSKPPQFEPPWAG